MRRKELARVQRLGTAAAEQDAEDAAEEEEGEDALLDYDTDEDDSMQVVSL